jgi:hypothetical protein
MRCEIELQIFQFTQKIPKSVHSNGHRDKIPNEENRCDEQDLSLHRQ